MNPGLEVRYWFDPAANAHCLLISKQLHDGTWQVAKPMALEFVDAPPQGTRVDPSMEFDGYQGSEIVKLLVEALSGAGVKTDSDAKLAGTLEATRYHLEDLRTALKNQGILRGAK